MKRCDLSLFLKLCLVSLAITTMFLKTSKAQNGNEEAGEDGGDGEEEEDEPERTCKEIVFGLVRGMLTSVTKCLTGQVAGFRLRSPFELLTRLYCIVKCVLTDQGMLNEEGQLDEVAALFYFQDNLPPSIIDAVVGVAQPCLGMAADFKSGEYYCNSFGPFVQCLFGSLNGAILPYVIDCFGTPGIGAFFSLINFLIPPGSGAGGDATNNELERRRRITAQQQNTTNLLAMLNSRRRNQRLRKKVKKPNNSTDLSWVHYARNITYFGLL